jgi:hypothetical protein
MAAAKPEYEIIEEFNTITVKLVNKFSEVFPNVDAEEFSKNIKCVGITNKDKTDTGSRADIKGITQPIRMFCEVGYVVTVYSSDWNEMNDKIKQNLVMSMIRRIPLDQESEGKVVPLDFKDDGMLVRTLGPDYLDRDDVPDLLKDNIEWIVR